jgi:rare lipoprotein A
MPCRCRTATAIGIVLCVTLAGCASHGNLRSPSGSSPASAGQPERSSRGNPPFYDVLGQRYHVLETSDGYRARGVASWYGRDFHGLSTSSGEIYDMHAMTAAHTTLPLPTWAEVTNLENGKRIVVKINDRGPFVANRLIDLSYAAAQELDMVRNGTARVEVRALPGAPGPRTARAQPAAATASSSRTAAGSASAGAAIATAPAAASAPRTSTPSAQTSMFVQVGAFAERANADVLVARLRAAGFGSAGVSTSTETGRTLHRVRVGPVASSSEFDTVRTQLARAGFGDSRLIVDR